jgi:hypothetical protein
LKCFRGYCIGQCSYKIFCLQKKFFRIGLDIGEYLQIMRGLEEEVEKKDRARRTS